MAENAPDRSRAPPSSVPERNEKRTRKANLIPGRKGGPTARMAENAPDRSRAPPSSVPERNEKRTRKANLIPRRAWPQRGWTPESREARSSPLLAPHELSALFSPVASSASIQRHPGGIDRHRMIGFA